MEAHGPSYSRIEGEDANDRSNRADVPGEEYELQLLESLDFENNLTEEHGMNAPVEMISDGSNGNSTMGMAFFNMANSILGAGIIGQPYAFKNSGLLGGIVITSLLAILIDWTLRLIVINAQKAKATSYQDTVFYCFGRHGRNLLLFSVSTFAYGGCMAFCVIIGDTIPHVLKAFIPDSITGKGSSFEWIFKRNTIIVLFTTCISYPLSLNRDISKLAKASGFAFIGMIIIVVLTTVRGFIDGNSSMKLMTKEEWFINRGLFKGISVISFALVCHHNTLFIFNSLRNATTSKFSKLTHLACTVSLFFCLLMGICGYLNFGRDVKGNILNNFSSDDTFINIARFFFGLNMLTTFPLEIFVVRDALIDVIKANRKEDAQLNAEPSSRVHIFITTLLVFTSMLVSLFTCNLGIILELIGAISASLMAYIIPPLCYLKLSLKESSSIKLDSLSKRIFVVQKVLPTVSCALFGILVMFISSFMSLNSSIKEGSQSHCVDD